MTENRKNSGFSLAELLVVVAIIGILMGVSFIAVQNYQRSSTRLEFDTIAREIFFAAQNHLTSVESQGYLQQKEYGHYGKIEGLDSADDIFYLVSGDKDSTEMLKLILPDYAITFEGSYIIRYQASSAKVLDVFYSNPGRSSMLTAKGKTLGTADYAPLMSKEPDYRENGMKNRERYSGGVVGWYGGEKAEEQGIRLRAPSLEIINAEKLMVRVTDPNAENIKESYLVKLIVTGKSSGAEAYFTLRDNSGAFDTTTGRITQTTDEPYTVVLDDITALGMHFANLNSDKQGKSFLPGENLEIKAVAYSIDTLSNIAMSRTAQTNSLFAELSDKDNDKVFDTAAINNIRHLENLDAAVSNLGTAKTASEGLETFEVTSAVQISDLDWETFKTKTKGESTTVYYSEDTGSTYSAAQTTKAKCYYPVSPDYAITYDGQGNSVLNLNIDFNGPAGMFGTLDGSNKKIENVIVRNSLENDSALEIKSTGGSAGGLVGSMTGGSITNCAAAVYVSGADAGGLIGRASGVTVKDSYAGGHTKHNSMNQTDHSGYLTGTSGEARVNVIATGDTGSAGGLIGSMSGGSATNCYSTCSVKGATAGGFAGTASGDISNSYCTGLVLGTGEVKDSSAVKAFVGSGTPTASGNYYYSIINDSYYAKLRAQSADGKTGIEELKAAASDSVARPFDKDRLNADDTITTAFQAYQAFLGDEFKPDEAKPYDAFLKNHYQKTGATDKTDYPLKTVKQLDTDPNSSVPDPLDIHYGDWPAPEILVVNPA